MDGKFGAEVHAVLVDIFCGSVDEAVLDFLCESLNADADLQEVIGPFLLDVGVATEASLESFCAMIAGRVGINIVHLDQIKTPVSQVLTQEACTAMRAHREAFLDDPCCEAAIGMLPPAPVEKAVRTVHEEKHLALWREEFPLALTSWSESLLINFHSELHSGLQTAAPEELAAVIRAMAETAGVSRARSTVIGKLADVVEECELDGALVFAGGEQLLQEKVFVKLKKSESSVVMHASRDAMTALREFVKLNAVDGYWSRLEMGSQEDQAMVAAFAGSPIEAILRRALQPRGRDEVVFSLHECSFSDVAHAQHSAQQTFDSSPGPPFRLASVVSTEQPRRVRQNLVYCNEAGEWLLLCSVDFARHGSAPSGHWHVNLTPGRDQVEHWGPRGSVFHGSWHGCPLWWLAIPEGTQHLQTPLRLRTRFGKWAAVR